MAHPQSQANETIHPSDRIEPTLQEFIASVMSHNFADLLAPIKFG
jgi:hypothetical protein